MNTKKILSLSIITALATVGVVSLSSCSSMPKGAKPIRNLELNRYLGNWYEIARFDFRYEKDVDNTTASYSLNEDGSVKVVNRGFNYKKNEWSESIGKAKLVEEPNVGRLKVSFFGPFYSGYNIIKLDDEYRYALVVGKNTNYIWFLSRTPEMPQEVKDEFVETARSLGYDLSRLVWVEHGNR